MSVTFHLKQPVPTCQMTNSSMEAKFKFNVFTQISSIRKVVGNAEILLSCTTTNKKRGEHTGKQRQSK